MGGIGSLKRLTKQLMLSLGEDFFPVQGTCPRAAFTVFSKKEAVVLPISGKIHSFFFLLFALHRHRRAAFTDLFHSLLKFDCLTSV